VKGGHRQALALLARQQFTHPFRISRAALLVKVMAAMWRASMPHWVDQIGDLACDDAGLPGAGAGQDQQRAVQIFSRLRAVAG
jgi:hypothetical protein